MQKFVNGYVCLLRLRAETTYRVTMKLVNNIAKISKYAIGYNFDESSWIFYGTVDILVE